MTLIRKNFLGYDTKSVIHKNKSKLINSVLVKLRAAKTKEKIFVNHASDPGKVSRIQREWYII